MWAFLLLVLGSKKFRMICERFYTIIKVHVCVCKWKSICFKIPEMNAILKYDVQWNVLAPLLWLLFFLLPLLSDECALSGFNAFNLWYSPDKVSAVIHINLIINIVYICFGFLCRIFCELRKWCQSQQMMCQLVSCNLNYPGNQNRLQIWLVMQWVQSLTACCTCWLAPIQFVCGIRCIRP